MVRKKVEDDIDEEEELEEEVEEEDVDDELEDDLEDEPEDNDLEEEQDSDEETEVDEDEDQDEEAPEDENYQMTEEASEDVANDRMSGLAADVPVQVVAVLGKRSFNVQELMNFHVGQVVDLYRPANETVDLVVGGKLIAKGELVSIDGKLGVKILKLI